MWFQETIPEPEFWDAKTGKQISSVEHGGFVYSGVLFSPDGKICSFWWRSVTKLFWDPATGKKISQIVHDGIEERCGF